VLFSAISGRRGFSAGLGLAMAFWMFACAPNNKDAKEKAWSGVAVALQQARVEACAFGASDLSSDMQEFFDVAMEWKKKL
jgi:hypothetical protein